MVHLTRIYTRTGDDGSTRLGDGASTRKTDERVEACGAVDEVNAAIGAVIAVGLDVASARLLGTVQNDLFDLGADLCVPASREESARTRLRVTAARVRRLEQAIDEINAGLEELRSFVLPGGSAAAAGLHVARAVCRRAERRAWALAEAAGEGSVNPQVLIYLNRLSDLLFVMSRDQNRRAGHTEALWVPGGDPPG